MIFRRFDSICHRYHRNYRHFDVSLVINSGFALVFFGVFRIYKIARANWVKGVTVTVDTNILRYLPRRSSKNCSLEFADSNRHRFMENYNIDVILMILQHSSPYLLWCPGLLDRLIAGQASHYRYGNTWQENEAQQNIHTFIWLHPIERMWYLYNMPC